jgi:hypothetical protein
VLYHTPVRDQEEWCSKTHFLKAASAFDTPRQIILGSILDSAARHLEPAR